MSRPDTRRSWPTQRLAAMFLIAATMGCRADMIRRHEELSAAPSPPSHSAAPIAAYDAKRDLWQYRAALSRWQAGDVDGAAELATQLLDRNPAHHDAQQLALQCAQAASGRSPARPEQAIRLVAADEPIPAPEPAPFAAAARDFQHQNPLQTVDRLNRLIADHPHDPQTYHRCTIAALRGGAPDIALEYASEGLNRFPDHLRLTQALALAQLRTGLLDSAQVTLRQALFLDSQDPLSYLLMGQTLAATGDYAAATWHHDRASALDPRYAALH